jgi:hypothetical protein
MRQVLVECDEIGDRYSANATRNELQLKETTEEGGKKMPIKKKDKRAKKARGEGEKTNRRTRIGNSRRNRNGGKMRSAGAFAGPSALLCRKIEEVRRRQLSRNEKRWCETGTNLGHSVLRRLRSRRLHQDPTLRNRTRPKKVEKKRSKEGEEERQTKRGREKRKWRQTSRLFLCIFFWSVILINNKRSAFVFAHRFRHQIGQCIRNKLNRKEEEEKKRKE